MKILSIDTAHGVCSVALSEGGEIISEKTDNEPSRQAERLFLTIEEILRENKLSYNDIKAIAANIGPGSFTGIRIGLAAARGIALAAKIPVIGVTGFEALLYYSSAKFGITSENILVVFNARRGQVFAQFFARGKGSEELLLEYGEIAAWVNGKGDFAIIGDGVELIESFLQDKSLGYLVERDVKLPDASMVAIVAFEKIKNGRYNTNPAPLYIRPPDAKLPKQA